MMELTCAFILILASLVFATPHGYGGYGVKGGASARAESNASARAFGGVGEVPVAVPLGAGYSGSFSKSSSSSSSSSSASASSSSSSFNYNGSGAGGYGLHGGDGAQGHGGCLSGNCQTAGDNGIPAPHGSSAQVYNSAAANAAATAGAGALSGSERQGLSCDDNSDIYTSGQCKPNPQTGTTSIDSDSKKCSSGQCGSTLENGASPTDYGSNDIRAVTESSDSAHSAKDHSSVDITSSAYNGAGSHCSQGECGPSGSINSKPNYYGQDSGNTYQGSSASNKQQASSSNIGITSNYQIPSTILETPKLGLKCNNFGNCETGEPGHETLPSSYNVPIHGTYDNGEPKPSCDGVKCENQPKGPYSPTHNSVTKEPSSFDYPSSTNCAGSSCLGLPANQVTGGPTLTVKPSNVNFGHSPSNVPTLSVTSCNSPNCSPYPTNSAVTAGSNVAPGKTSDVNKPLHDKLPAYTGGFGGPAGILNPNEYDVTAPTGKPSHGHASTSQNGKPLEIVPTGCNSPSCSGYPSAPAPGPNVPTGAYHHKPGSEVPSEKLPSYTGVGYPSTAEPTAPTGTYYNKPGSEVPVEKLPSLTGAGYPSAPGLNVPTGTYHHKPGSEVTSEKLPSYTGVGYPSASGPTASTGTYYDKPSSEVPNEKLPTYTGGFGGPAGMLKPNEFDVHTSVTNKPNYAHPGSSSYNKQPTLSNLGTPGCKTGNCAVYSPTAVAASGATAPSGFYGTTKPSTGISSPSEKLPAYTGGFGGPGGVFNPDKIDTHASGPSSPGHTPSGIYNTPTSSGHPGGCKTPNCYPSLGSTAAANAQAESFGVTKPSSGPHLSSVTMPAYTSSYDRPSGVPKPNEIGGPTSTPSFTHTLSPSSLDSYSTDCKTGNCANYPTSSPSAGAGANAQTGSFVITKPHTNVNPVAPTIPQYTGGFGGPSGTYKPNEHPYVTLPTGSAPTNCGTPNCIGLPTVSGNAISGANAQAASYGITKPSGGNNLSNEKPLYTGGFGGAPGLLKPNEYTVAAVSPTPNNKPTGVSAPAACTSGNCNPHVPHGSAPHPHNDASNGAHSTAAAAAEANAVAYSGGFGGPPGFLQPYDDGKIGALPANGRQAHGAQIGGTHYGSHNANIHSLHGTIPGANSDPTGPAGLAGAHGNTGSQAGSNAGSTAYAGAAAGSSAGAYGSHYNQPGNVKGGSPCSGGCGGTSGGTHNGGSGGGAYNDGSSFDISGGHGFPKLGYSDGLSGGGRTSGAAAKSLAGASAFGVGGSYASSSASAHASAGAYTKGGYGKR